MSHCKFISLAYFSSSTNWIQLHSWIGNVLVHFLFDPCHQLDWQNGWLSGRAMKHLTGLISHRPVRRRVQLGGLTQLPFNGLIPWCQIAQIFSCCQQEIVLRLKHVWNFGQWEHADVTSPMSDGAGPPRHVSLCMHLFSELEPSRLWSILRCGLCHPDLFSSTVTSWPLDCLCLSSLELPPPASLQGTLPNSSNRMSAGRAAEDLNRSGLMSPLHRSLIWGL